MTEEVRVRFAPAPTGHLHIGNIRTCLFNWLFARHHNGKVILRIEDTDVARSQDAACDTIVDDLSWIGLDWDEGYAVGGRYGPYRQSERLDLYRKYAEDLISHGNAYFCFCTPEELERERQAYLARGRMPRYSEKCRNLTSDDVARLSVERTPAMRFRVPQDTVVLDDMIKGEIGFDSSTIGDFIIMRPDGFPTYNFAVVVDDAEMKVTHIIRGDEHISNTPRQIMLYEALGFPVPRFGHVAMILGEDKTKLSKRHGATSLSYYKEAGYLPEAILNYLSLLGWTPGDTREIMSLQEIAAEFGLDRVSKSPSVFDTKKLDWFNSHYIRACNPDRLLDLALPYLRALGISEDLSAEGEERERLEKIIVSVQDSISNLSEIPQEVSFFFGESVEVYDESAKKWIYGPTAKPGLAEFIEVFSNPDDIGFGREEIPAGLKTVIGNVGVGARKVLMPIRAALTGRTKGPELHVIMEILGRERSIRRVRTALSDARGNKDVATDL
jgi:nondiscriminating glutamyl-tRNA synthetase